MTDYSKLIDAETWAFIERTNAFYPPDAVNLSVEEQRAVYDRMCREFFAGYPEGVTAGDATIPATDHEIPIRIYDNEAADDAALVLYFHGGGFVVGGLESHDDVCAEICARTGYRTVSVDYRLAPEHRHPAAFQDALAAYKWSVATYGRPILLCGDSAGGNLAAAVAHAVRGKGPQPAGQVLIYPGLGGDIGARSYVEHAEAPMLTTRDIAFYGDIRGAGAGDPTAAPLQDRDFSRLPPTVIVSAECDPLASDGEAYRDRLLAAGGRAVWFEEQGLVHGYLRARTTVERARRSFDRIAEALQALGRGAWPW